MDRGEVIPVVEEQPTKKVGEGEAAVDVPVSEGEEDAVIPLLKECETPSLWTLPDPPSLTLLLEQLVPTRDRGMERAFKALEVQSQERGLQDTTGVEQVLDTCHSPVRTRHTGVALQAPKGGAGTDGDGGEGWTDVAHKSLVVADIRSGPRALCRFWPR